MARQTQDQVRLSKQEFDALLDREARKRLGMSGAEFKGKHADGTLPDSVAVRDVGNLLKLVREK